MELFRRGIRGIISRAISPDLLVRCVRCIASGETWIDNQAMNWVIEAYRVQEAALLSPPAKLRLSPKQREIITCITQGMRNKEIAFQLGTTEQVIKNYLRKIYTFSASRTALNWPCTACTTKSSRQMLMRSPYPEGTRQIAFPTSKSPRQQAYSPICYLNKPPSAVDDCSVCKWLRLNDRRCGIYKTSSPSNSEYLQLGRQRRMSRQFTSRREASSSLHCAKTSPESCRLIPGIAYTRLNSRTPGIP